MAKPLLDDALWAALVPLLPKPRLRRKRHPGRRPVDDRTVLRGLLFVLKSGIAWEDFPQELGRCGMTLLNRLRQWQRAGAWDAMRRAMLGRLRKAGRLDLSRVIVDSASVRAIHGGKERARAPSTARKPAASTSWPPTPTATRW